MSFRTTALLFGILLWVLGLFGLMLARQRTKLDEGLVLPTLSKDQTVEIGEVQVEREGHKYTFFKTSSGWNLRIDPYRQALRADDGRVREIINDIKSARKTEEADVSRNLAEYGLEKPVEKIILKTEGGGKEWVLNVGKESPDKGYLYVNSSDRPNDVLAVRRSRLKSVLIPPKEIDKYRSMRLLDISDATAKLVDLKPGADTKGRELTLEKGKGAVWVFKKPPYGQAEYEGAPVSKEPTGVRGLLNTLGAIRPETDADFVPLSQPLFPESKAVLRVDVERAGERGAADKTVKETLLIGPKVESKEKGDGKKGDGKKNAEAGGQYYARLANDEAMVRVDARNVDILLGFTRKPDALRSHDLAQIETGKPDVIRVSSGKGPGEVVTLYKPQFGEWLVTDGAMRHKANESAIQGPDGLLSQLQGKNKVKEFFDVDEETTKDGKESEAAKAKDKELGLDNPRAKVVVWVNGQEKEANKAKDEKKAAAKQEPKKGEKEAKKGPKEAAKDEKKEEKAADGPQINPKAKPVLTLTFGKTAGDLVYVKRVAADGSVSRVAVPKSVLEKVAPPQGALAYLDPNVASFLVTDVARLELKVREGKQERLFVVEREGEKKGAKDKLPLPGGWLLLEPKDFKERPNADAAEVEKVLNALTRVSAVRYVKKVEPKENLGAYGLNPPAVTATITLKKKEGEKEPARYTYLFGSEATPDKSKPSSLYAVMTGGGELKDIVFEVSPVIVMPLKDVELRDRTVFRFDPAKVKEVRLTIRKELTVSPVFTRKDRSWVVTKGLEEFPLDPARVEQLVDILSNLKALRYVSFNGPEKEHGLTDKPRLRIEVVMDDNKTTYTLTIGAAQEKVGYFAESSTLPRAVFLVALPHFQRLVDDGVTYFRQK
jgi:hypothetical protein